MIKQTDKPLICLPAYYCIDIIASQLETKRIFTNETIFPYTVYRVSIPVNLSTNTTSTNTSTIAAAITARLITHFKSYGVVDNDDGFDSLSRSLSCCFETHTSFHHKYCDSTLGFFSSEHGTNAIPKHSDDDGNDGNDDAIAIALLLSLFTLLLA